MSGGEIGVLPAALVVVPIAAAVLGAGMAAALVIRGAAAGTEATGRLLEHLGDEMARMADAQADAAIRTRLWEVAAGAVVHTNQELRLLAARAEKVGIQLALPQPIDLTGCMLADTRALVAQAQDALAGARAEVVRAEVEREKRTLLAKLAVPADDLPTAADLLARHQEVLDRRRKVLDSHQEVLDRRRADATAGAQKPAPRAADRPRVLAEIDGILLRLDPDATAEDRQQVLVAAARAERKGNAAASRTYLEALRRLVDKEVNPKIGRRREAAGLLAGLTHPVITAMIGELPSPRPPFLSSIDRLLAVVRGEADLTDEDRADAHRMLAWAQRELERRRLLDGLIEAFAGLGYLVTTGLQVHHSASLSVTRPSWHGGHTADVWVDEAGNVHSRLVQVAPGAVGEATRCAELNASMRGVGDELVRRGMDASVDLPEQPVPALKRYGINVPPGTHEDVGPNYHAPQPTED